MPDDSRCIVDDDNGGRRRAASKTRATIASLDRLLRATPAAEELATSWYAAEAKKPQGGQGARLRDLYNALDDGRTIAWTDDKDGRQRGVPMWIVVRTCKAQWHFDGTWPLVGRDESVGRKVVAQVGEEAIAQARSVHPADALLRPLGVHAFTVPAVTEERKIRPERSADEIARAYQLRKDVT